MVYMDPHQVYRVYASSRDPNGVPKNLLVSISWQFYIHRIIWLQAMNQLWSYRCFSTLMATTDLINKMCDQVYVGPVTF